ncbi:MAG TPA: Ig-like domain-containing protein, partial [bacterium]|nr:Ig-like domain-containing protein [bacterium]
DDKRYSMNAGLVNDGTVDLVQIIASGNDGIITTGSKEFSVTTTPFVNDSSDYFIEMTGAANSADNGRWKIKSFISSGKVELDHIFASDNTNIAWTLVKKYHTVSEYYPNLPDNGDVAEFEPVTSGRDAQLMPAGANMRLKVYFSLIANLYNFSTLPGVDITYSYTVESTPPVISTSGIKAVSETLGFVEADGATDIKADSKITLIFNEDIDPKSVNSDSIKILDKNNAAVDFSYTTNGNVVTATPVNYLQSGLNPYEVTATTFIKDVAGNALAADVSAEFSVETTPPDFVATNPADVTPAWSVSKPLEIYFTEPMNTASVKAGTFVTYDVPVDCNSGDITGIVEGCIAIDRTKTFVTFTPYSGQFMDETDYVLVVKATPSDLAGNILGGGDHEFSFDTKAGDNGPANAMCGNLPSSEAQTYVDVYFSEPVDPISVILGTVTVYDVNNDEEIAGTISLQAGDTVIRFTADPYFAAGHTYGIIISDQILGTDGLPIVEYYRAFFNIPL